MKSIGLLGGMSRESAITAQLDIPLLHIIDTTAEAIQAQGITDVGILAALGVWTTGSGRFTRVCHLRFRLPGAADRLEASGSQVQNSSK